MRHRKIKIKKFNKICIRKECNNPFSTNIPIQSYCHRLCRIKDMKNRIKPKYIKKGSYLELRFFILKRDNFTCQYCGKNPKEDKIKLHLDHIIPVSKGGLTNKDNLITSCQECNIGKSNKF